MLKCRNLIAYIENAGFIPRKPAPAIETRYFQPEICLNSIAEINCYPSFQSSPGEERAQCKLGALVIRNKIVINEDSKPQYVKGSPERARVEKALESLRAKLPVQSDIYINGKVQAASQSQNQVMPSEHKTVFTNYPITSREQVAGAIDSALAAKKKWEATPFVDRVAIFQRAAELVTGRYRDELIAATMLGQGKNMWQAEIDAAAELADFFRLNCNFAAELLGRQPTRGTDGIWT